MRVITLLGMTAIVAGLALSTTHLAKLELSTIKYGPAVNITLPMVSTKVASLPNVSSTQKIITIEKANTLVLNGAVTAESVAKLQLQLLKMSNTLSKDAVIYLVLKTPGGSIDEGVSLIEDLKNIPQKVHTITIFAASMGFMTVQSLGTRYITNNGVLMSHRAALGGLAGQISGELESRLAMIKRLVTYLEVISSNRMKMKLEDYKQMIVNEYWVHGFDAIGQNAADEKVGLLCGKSMMGTTTETVKTFFGNVDLIMSECPTIVGPVGISTAKVDPTKKAEVYKFINELYNDQAAFTKNYILTNKYSLFIK